MPDAFDDARNAVAKTDALAHALETLFDAALWPPGIDHQELDRLAHLVGCVAEAAALAVNALDKLNADAVQTTIKAGEGGW